MYSMPRLKLRSNSGSYSKGQTRATEILEAALDILLDHGYQSLSMRRIAAACGITLGNVTYYYPTKDQLVRDLLESVVQSYMDTFDAIRNDPTMAPEDQFVTVIRLLLEDIQTKKTTHLFPQLWTLSNHDSFISERVDELYVNARQIFNDLIPILNPALTDHEREVVALFVSASIEGMTMFAGYEKPWAPDMPLIEGIAAKSLLECVKTITADDIYRFAPDRKGPVLRNS